MALYKGAAKISAAKKARKRLYAWPASFFKQICEKDYSNFDNQILILFIVYKDFQQYNKSINFWEEWILKKLLSIALSFMLCAGSMTACNSDSGSGSSAASGAASAKQSTDTGKSVTLVWMDHTDEQNQKNFEDKMAKEFHEKHPNVSIDIQRLSYDNYATSLQTKVASGDAPDMFYTEGDQMRTFNKNGYLTDLSSEPFIKNYNKNDLGLLTIGNKVVGIGMTSASMCAVYNKDVFQKAGISAPPKTLDEFYADCDKLKAGGVDPIAHGYKETWCLSADMQTDYITGILSKDKNSILNLTSRKTKFADSKDWKDEFTRLAKRFSYGSKDPFGTDSNGAYTEVATGKAGMILNGDWAVSGIKALNKNANLGIFAVPYSNNAGDTKLLIQAPSQGISIYSGTENKDLCLAFLNQLSTPEAGSTLAQMAQKIPTIIGANPPSEPAYQDVFKYIDEKKTFNQGSIDHNFPNENRTALETDVSTFLVKKQSVGDLCKALDTDFDKIASSK
jgi:ABC-type glycerol-3-phosphate transport system substrate-binding protein